MAPTATLTAEEKAAGIRVDPDTGEKLRRGVLTRRELEQHLARMNGRWRAWAFGPRPADGDWTMVPGIGWIRSAGGKAK